jgi:chromosome partitioning protein
MAIITIATTKGGAGKTTLARVILARKALQGCRLAAIDSDLNRTLADWVENIAKTPITVRHELDETAIVPLASDLHDSHDLVVIDTAGAGSQATVFAIGCADLVLIPLQPSLGDIVEAIKTHNLVKSCERMLRHAVPARVVLMSVQATTNVAEHIEREVVKAGLPLLQTRISRLVAFQEMSFTGVAPVSGVAGGQATAFLSELDDLGIMPQPQQLAS